MELIDFGVKPKSRFEKTVEELIESAEDFKTQGNDRFSSKDISGALYKYEEVWSYFPAPGCVYTRVPLCLQATEDLKEAKNKIDDGEVILWDASLGATHPPPIVRLRRTIVLSSYMFLHILTWRWWQQRPGLSAGQWMQYVFDQMSCLYPEKITCVSPGYGCFSSP